MSSPKKPKDQPHKHPPRGYTKQVGSSLSYWASSTIYGFLGHPEYLRLAEYERAMTTDETIKSAIRFIRLSIQGSLGEYVHPDPEIQQFVRDNLNRMKGSYKSVLGELIVSSLWSGFGVSEVVYKAEDGRIWIDYVTNYNPRNITFHVNENGMLTEGEKAAFNSGFSTGIWQDRIGKTPVRLPMNRCVMVTHEKRHNNYYGESALKPVYKNWRLKEAVLEMWNIALDRYGTPVTYAVVPNGYTGREVPDMSNPGKQRPETIADSTEQAIANIHTGTGLVIERPSPTDDIDLGTLTTGNNFGEAFRDALKYYNKAIYQALLIPALLLSEQDKGGLGSGNATAIHFEVYKLILNQIYDEIVEPFVEQCIGRLIRLNFGHKDPGRFEMSPYDIATAQATAQMAGLLKESGGFDNTNPRDINWLRARCGMEMLDEAGMKKLVDYNKRMADAVIKQMTATVEGQKVQKELGHRGHDINEKMGHAKVKTDKAKMEIDREKMQADIQKEKIKIKQTEMQMKQQAQEHAHVASGAATTHEAEKAKIQMQTQEHQVKMQERAAKTQMALHKTKAQAQIQVAKARPKPNPGAAKPATRVTKKPPKK